MVDTHQRTLLTVSRYMSLPRTTCASTFDSGSEEAVGSEGGLGDVLLIATYQGTPKQELSAQRMK